MSAASNDNGRALEYIIVDYLLKINLFSPTSATLEDQKRDIGKYKSLNNELKNDFNICTPKIVKWIVGKLQSHNTLKIDRLKDNDAHVADIQFRDTNEKIILNLSIKNNHAALKHPRPYSTVQACGFKIKSPQDVFFRKQMQIISEQYRNKVFPEFTEYSETGQNLVCLYGQVCDHHINWLNPQSNPKVASNLFTFIVNTNFYQIKVNPTKKIPVFIEVSDFRNIALPQSFKAYRPTPSNPDHKNHFRVEFDNNWEVDFRIHSAESVIKKNRKLKNGKEKFVQLSLKFDVSAINKTVSPIII